jgi:probable rRNA maturation factor
MPIEIHNLQNFLPVDLARVERAARAAAAPCADPDLSLSLVGDAEIQDVNARFLGHDRPTDVISFDYADSPGGERVSGEVIVSAECAVRVAQEHGGDATAELMLYVIHGILHLRGFDDQEVEDASAMWRRQSELMRELGYPAPASDPSP